MMANPGKDTLEGTSFNNGAPANAGAPGSKTSSEGLDDNLKAQAAAAVSGAAGAGAAAAASAGAPGTASSAGEGANPEAGTPGATAASETSAAASADASQSTSSEGEPASAQSASSAEAAAANNDEAVAKAAAEVAEWKDKYVRLHAEWDTYRRRINEQREEEKARATEKLVVSLLPLLDDLERTIDYAEKNGEQGLLGGVQAILAKFVDTLQKDGVQMIDPKGEAFNALEDQAVGTVDDASQPDETVADVYQKGYKMGSKVLRPAMVTVTTGGPKRPQED